MCPANGSGEVIRKQLEIADQLVKLDVPTLFEMIGMQTIGLEDPLEIQSHRDIADFSINIASARLRGQAFFEKQRAKLRQTICQDWKFCDKAGQYENDFEKMMNALIPLVLSALGSPMIGCAIVVSVLLFKYGLRTFCECK
jgi:hypothetical protein